LRFQIAVAALVFILFAASSGSQSGRTEAVPALMQTEYSTYYSTLTSTYVSRSARTTTETQYGTIYLTAYHRQYGADGPDVKVRGRGRVALSGYTADVSATVENLSDDIIFNVAVTFQVVQVYADGNRIKMGTGAKLKFKESILPRESITASDTVRIEYNPAYGDGYGTGPVPPPYLPKKDYDFALDFWGVDFSTYPFRTATATVRGYSTATETHVAISTLTYISTFVPSSVGLPGEANSITAACLLGAAVGGLALMALLRKRKRTPSRELPSSKKVCPSCRTPFESSYNFCPECGRKWE